MTKINRYVLLVIALFCSCAIAKADNEQADSLSRRRYPINEEWYIQVMGGVNYMLADNTRFVPFTKVLSPEFSFSLGKRFTPIWGTRLQVSTGNNKGVFFPNDKNSPMYTFGNTAVYGIGTFNLTEVLDLRKNGHRERNWNVNFELGIGTIYSNFVYVDDITKGSLNRNNSTYLTLFGGVEVARKLSSKCDIALELSTNWMNEKFNGQTSAKGNNTVFDGMVNLMIGVRYNFRQAKKKSPTSQSVNTLVTTFVPPVQTQAIVQTQTVKRTTVREDVFYSVDDLLEMLDNGESIQGKHLASTENIKFDFGKTGIKAFNLIYLDKMIELVKKSNGVLVIRGFVAEKKSPFRDMMTEQRMNSVRDYAISKGIHRDRMIYQYIKEAETPFTKEGQEQIVEFGLMVL